MRAERCAGGSPAILGALRNRIGRLEVGGWRLGRRSTDLKPLCRTLIVFLAEVRVNPFLANGAESAPLLYSGPLPV